MFNTRREFGDHEDPADAHFALEGVVEGYYNISPLGSYTVLILPNGEKMYPGAGRMILEAV